MPVLLPAFAVASGFIVQSDSNLSFLNSPGFLWPVELLENKMA